MTTFITTIHIVTCVLLILVVLLQSGKGAEISASFGGSSQTVFGSSGGANFFTRFTSIMAAVFMSTSLYLTWRGTRDTQSSVMEHVARPVSAAPVSAAPVDQSPASAAVPAGTAPAPAAPAAPATSH